jgi:hypothetical protein
MKKQLLISAIFVLALLSSISNSYAQCGDALNPMAGKKYTYSVDVNPTGGTFDWFVTSNTNLATATAITSVTGVATATDIIVAGTGYNTVGSLTASIDITWTAKAVFEATKLISPVKYYLVVKYKTDCTNNIKPWRIKPMNLFQIAVENVNSEGAAAYTPICRVGFVGADIDANDKVTYNFGENALYIKVTAKNFTTSWTPKIDMSKITPLIDALQTLKSIEWSLTTTFTGTSNFDLATGIATAAVPDKGNDNITTGDDEFIYIKILIIDNKFEGLADQTFPLNLSATDIAGNIDVDVDATCKTIPEDDNLTQILKARPAITNPNPTPFLTAN